MCRDDGSSGCARTLFYSVIQSFSAVCVVLNDSAQPLAEKMKMNLECVVWSCSSIRPMYHVIYVRRKEEKNEREECRGEANELRST